jgi:hypothetical protein
LSARPKPLLAFAIAALGLFGGCQIGVSVGVDAHADGGGEVRVAVRLDRDAAAQAPDLASQLKVDDLRRAGWKVTGPVAVAGGGVEARAVHPFATPAQAAMVVDQLSGPTGPFRRFRLTRNRSLLKTRTRFRGEVDLSAGAASFGDPVLQEKLGSPIGVDQAALERRLGSSLSKVFRVTVAARLPGHVSSNAPTAAANGAEWRPQLGERVTLVASAEQWNVRRIAFGLLAALAVLALVITEVRRRRH